MFHVTSFRGLSVFVCYPLIVEFLRIFVMKLVKIGQYEKKLYKCSLYAKHLNGKGL